ncbi:MAG: DUF4157 domain-containing protein [Bacteroidetes bacterium]|nr:DUF4157 domain-containing protein [Bacteroidota bacterium]
MKAEKISQKKSSRVIQTKKDNNNLSIVDNRNLSTIQRKMSDIIQRKNDTGLPNNLKSGIENLSNYKMDDVSVHYNSSKPAQMQSLAYAQGNNIHISSGQEKHLPHEAWHVVQQKQGRVKPTMQMQGINVNDDISLEKEADVMGNKAMQMKVGSGTIQKMAWQKSRSLGSFGSSSSFSSSSSSSSSSGKGKGKDWNIGFGNLKLNHRHIIFDNVRALPVGNSDNVGFHADGGGSLFSENVANFGYKNRGIISHNEEEDAKLTRAIDANNPPGEYSLIKHNCQDWVSDVRKTAGL